MSLSLLFVYIIANMGYSATALRGTTLTIMTVAVPIVGYHDAILAKYGFLEDSR